jgi:hypothetical protein
MGQRAVTAPENSGSTHIPLKFEERLGEVGELVDGRVIGVAVVHEGGMRFRRTMHVVRCVMTGRMGRQGKAEESDAEHSGSESEEHCGLGRNG